jgi:hypothetical protein
MSAALGTGHGALWRTAELAYPLSTRQVAYEYLLRDLNRFLEQRSRSAGTDAALAGLTAAAVTPETLVRLLRYQDMAAEVGQPDGGPDSRPAATRP